MTRFLAFAALVAAAVLAGCASSPAPLDPDDALRPRARFVPDTGERPPAANIMQPGHAPTPFSTAEVRAGAAYHGDRVYVLRGVPGLSAVEYRTSGITDAGCTLTVTEFESNGEPYPDRAERQTWDELRGSTSFPAEAVTIRDAQVLTIAGEFDCWAYVLEVPGEIYTVLYFARNLPGMAVLRRDFTPDGYILEELELISFGAAGTL